MGISQPSFRFNLRGRPTKHGATLTKKEAERAKDILKNLQTDYAIQIYIKDKPVGHGSKYTMGELAHHLMVEGVYSKRYAASFLHQKGRPPSRMIVERDAKGNAIRDSNGKYVLENVSMYKKVWNFVDNAAKANKNWRNIVRMIPDKIVRQAIQRRNYLIRHGGHNVQLKAQTNYYREMQALGRKIVADCKLALLALEAPPLEATTIKKKGHDKILQESRALYNSIAYRVVKLKPTSKGGNQWIGKPFVFGKADKTHESITKGMFNAAVMQGFSEKSYAERKRDRFDSYTVGDIASWSDTGNRGGDDE